MLSSPAYIRLEWMLQHKSEREKKGPDDINEKRLTTENCQGNTFMLEHISNIINTYKFSWRLAAIGNLLLSLIAVLFSVILAVFIM